MSKKKTEKLPSDSAEESGRSSKSLQRNSNYERYDLDNDGIVSDDEIQSSKELLELELREDKFEAQKSMSWVALISMLVLTVIVLTPLISESKLSLLDDLISMYYIAMAGIIGAYFGVSGWVSKSK